MAKPAGIFGIGAAEEGRRGLSLGRELAQAEAWAEAILPADATAPVGEGATNRRPLLIFAGLVAAIMAVLVLRLAGLQLINGSHNLALADGNRIRQMVVRAPRGLIYDSTGQVLATNQPAYDVTVTPLLLPPNPTTQTAVYAQVASLIGQTPEQVAAAVTKACGGSTTGCANPFSAELVKADVSHDQALLFAQHEANLPGFSLDVNPTRQYVDTGNLLAPFLGYTGRITPDELKANPADQPTDLVGQAGLELSYEDVLKGQPGVLQTEVDATGKPVKVLAQQASQPGNNLVLGVDQALEQEMASVIQSEMQTSGTKRAAGVAVNPNNGDILAAVSLPTYDNNLFAKGISQTNYNKLVNDPGQPLFNKVTSGEYPSGSIIKPLVASAALQQGIINASTTINDTGKLVVPNPYNADAPYIYYGWDHNGLGPMNVFNALAQSSDIFFYTVAGGFTNFTHYLGVNQLTHYYQQFGLGTKTGIDIPYESKGLVPTPAWKQSTQHQPWYTGDTYNIAIGQGNVLVTPLQMVMATAVIANGGTLYKPHFVDHITDEGGQTVQTIKPEVVRKDFVSAANLALVRQGMFNTINDSKGTACCKLKDELPQVQIAGKTGTAETATGQLPEAWFSSFAPYNNPQIVMVIFFEKAGEGADYAAPAARQIYEWYFTQDPAGKAMIGK